MKLELDMIQSLGIAMLAFILGGKIKKRFKFFQKYFIPSPVIGGLIVSLLVFILKNSGKVDISFEGSLQNFFMNIFFTAIGFTCSFKVLKKSGPLGLKLAFAIILLLPIQNLIGVYLSKLMGINPLHGIAMGSVSMTGGIGSAVSFGPVMEKYGAVGNTEIGVAAATFGLLSGSLVGGPVARRLIKKNNLKSKGEDASLSQKKEVEEALSQASLMSGVLQIALAAFLGTFINKLLLLTKQPFPYYVGCQFGGAVLRNIYDAKNPQGLKMKEINILGNISLNIFLSLALISLNISAILNLAGQMLIIMAAQAIFIAFYTSEVTFKLCGKDYDAAVMAAGHCGVGLGQTPNAMANMTAIIEESGPADTAMFVLPIVLAIAVNLTNPLIITYFINVFK